MDRGKNILHTWTWALAATVMIAASAVVVTTSVAPAASGAFTVDDPVDAPDAAIDGVCATATDTCTLRAAVQEADAAGGTTDIAFAPSADAPSLSIAGSGGADVGDLDVDPGATVRITGNVPTPGSTTQVKADAMADRHFHVHAGGRLELVHVALVGGSSTGDGGAVLNEGDVLISNTPTGEGDDVALAGNTAAGVGGAIANGPGATLTVSNVSTAAAGSRIDLTGNRAKFGGAIANEGGTVLLQGSSPASLPSHDVYLDSNSAVADGGAVWNESGSLTLGCRAFLRFSTADTGGDLHNAGTTTFRGGGVDGGTATTAGGGVFNDTTGAIAVAADDGCGPAQVTRSTSGGNGGGIYNQGAVTVADKGQLAVSGAGGGPDAVEGAGVYQEGGTIAVSGVLSVGDGNAQGGGGGILLGNGSISTDGTGRILLGKNHADLGGGGVSVLGGTLTATVVADGNNSNGPGGGLGISGGRAELRQSAVVNSSSSQGGGIAVSGGSIYLENTTLSQNVSASGGGALALTGGGAALRHVTVADNSTGVSGVPVAQPTLQRVLMARNNGKDCQGPVISNDDNAFDEGTCSPQGTDLTDGSRFTDVADRLDGNIGDGDPYSYALHEGNPAIDLVTDGGCGTPAVDQVGDVRPTDGDGDGNAACDAGAIEAPDAAPDRVVSGTVTSEITHLPMPGVCVFAGRIDGPDGGSNDHMAVTDADGNYVHQVPAGQYLVAFFVPKNPVLSPKGCGDGNAIDLSIQPEWYRNVPVTFRDPSDPNSDPVFPSLSEVSPVEVKDEDVVGIDACLGHGPGAGEDAPCAVASQVVDPNAEAATTATAPPVASGAPTSGSSTGVSSGAPTKLAFTGTDLSGVWLGLFMVVAGAAMALVAARRPRGLLVRR